jgi:hypothetical protein
LPWCSLSTLCLSAQRPEQSVIDDQALHSRDQLPVTQVSKLDFETKIRQKGSQVIRPQVSKPNLVTNISCL